MKTKNSLKAYLVQESSGHLYFTQRKPRDGSSMWMLVDVRQLRNELQTFTSSMKLKQQESDVKRVFKTARWSPEDDDE